MGGRRPPRPDRGRRPEHRSGNRGRGGTGRGYPQHLRAAHARHRRCARRSMARGRSPARERLDALPLPPETRGPVPRRADADGARRPLLLRAAPPEPRGLRPVAPLCHPGGQKPHRRRGRRARGLPHCLAYGVHHRPGETGLLLPGPRVRSPARPWCPREPARSAESWRRGCVGTGPFRVAGVRAGAAIGAPAEPRLLARGLPQERGARLPVRGLARGDQERVPGRPPLGRLGPPSRRRRRAPSRPALPVGLPGDPEARDVLRRLQRTSRRAHRREAQTGARRGDRCGRDRPADAATPRTAGDRPDPAGPARVLAYAAVRRLRSPPRRRVRPS